MASSSERRDGKLESFLNRVLPAEEYERLLTRQPAVAAVSDAGRGAAGKPAHRHAVLGHCKLYMTDVPPKNIKMTLQLRHMESIQIVDEPAEFLQGKQRDDAVHVQIYFTRETKPEKNLLSSLGDLSPSLTRHLFNASTSAINKKPAERLSLPSQRITRTSESVKKSSSYHSLTHLDQLQQKAQFSSPQLTTKSRGSSRGRHTIQSPLSLHGTSSSSPSERQTCKSLSPLTDSTHAVSISPLEDRKRLLLQRSLEPSPPRSSTVTPNLSCDVKQPQLNSRTPACLSDDSLCSSQSSPTILLSSASHSTPTLSPSSRNSSPHSSSSGGLESPERDSGKREAKRERCVLDLYLLSPNTDFYQHLHAAWLDQKIAVTLASDQPTHPPKSPRHISSDHFSHHFHSLKQELLAAKTSRESSQLIRELCSACQKYFAVKRLFWESPELVDHLINVLQHMPSKTSAKKMSTELEYRVVVLEVMYQMLRETHGLQRRCLALTGSSGRSLRRLLTAIISLIPTLNQLELMDDEVVEKSCSILSEILRLAQQMRWPCAPGGVVSLDWTLDILAKHPHIREFCGVVVSHESSLLRLEHLEPRQLVCLYHMTSILHCLVTHSPPLLTLLHTHFSEEFKYFLSVTQAKRKLPVTSPLTSHTLSLLQQTKSRVLQN